VSLAVTAIIIAFFTFRLLQLKKQHQIRQSISSDLHDDIGATLNSVRLFTHMAITTPAKGEYLNQAMSLLNQATTGLRDMVWVLDDSRDSTEDFISRIKQFAAPVAEASNISFSFDIQDGIRNELLNKEEKRNLFLIAKEVINNSIKYAGCSVIQVTLSQVHKKTSLIIKDNGCGFAEATVARGNGLNNIRERAKQIHYTAHIAAAPGMGTCVTISKK
jgi:signal transduction histidine kinase